MTPEKIAEARKIIACLPFADNERGHAETAVAFTAALDALEAEQREYDTHIGWAKQAGVEVERLQGGTMVERVVDAEQSRWQKSIDEVVLAMDPDRDGSGCDSGDPLDLTMTELRVAWSKVKDALEAVTRERDAMREALERAISIIDTEGLENSARELRAALEGGPR